MSPNSGCRPISPHCPRLSRSPFAFTSRRSSSSFFFRAGAGVGAYVGAVLAPIVDWIFLRHVSLIDSIAHGSLGALLGIAADVAESRVELAFFRGDHSRKFSRPFRPGFDQ